MAGIISNNILKPASGFYGINLAAGSHNLCTGNINVNSGAQGLLFRTGTGLITHYQQITLNNGTTNIFTVNSSGDLAVNINKFTVAGSTGNTVIAGTLGVTLATTLSSTLEVTGNFKINSTKFQVTASSGDTAIAGTLGVTGLSTLAGINCTAISGTSLSVSGAISGATINGATITATTFNGLIAGHTHSGAGGMGPQIAANNITSWTGLTQNIVTTGTINAATLTSGGYVRVSAGYGLDSLTGNLILQQTHAGNVYIAYGGGTTFIVGPGQVGGRLTIAGGDGILFTGGSGNITGAGTIGASSFCTTYLTMTSNSISSSASIGLALVAGGGNSLSLTTTGTGDIVADASGTGKFIVKRGASELFKVEYASTHILTSSLDLHGNSIVSGGSISGTTGTFSGAITCTTVNSVNVGTHNHSGVNQGGTVSINSIGALNDIASTLLPRLPTKTYDLGSALALWRKLWVGAISCEGEMASGSITTNAITAGAIGCTSLTAGSGNVSSSSGYIVIKTGSGAPTGTPAAGSMYLRTDGIYLGDFYVFNGSTWDKHAPD